jgi:hypothetical protein
MSDQASWSVWRWAEQQALRNLSKSGDDAVRQYQSVKRRSVYEFGEGWWRRRELSAVLTIKLANLGMPFWLVGLPYAVIMGRWADWFAAFGDEGSYWLRLRYRRVRVGLWRLGVRLPQWRG